MPVIQAGAAPGLNQAQKRPHLNSQCGQDKEAAGRGRRARDTAGIRRHQVFGTGQ